MTRRLFLAMDDDNTGAMEVTVRAAAPAAAVRGRCVAPAHPSRCSTGVPQRHQDDVRRGRHREARGGVEPGARELCAARRAPPSLAAARSRRLTRRAPAALAVAFNLFDLDREKTVDQSEIKSFLKTFYSEAKHMVVRSRFLRPPPQRGGSLRADCGVLLAAWLDRAVRGDVRAGRRSHGQGWRKHGQDALEG